jgi:hypothetical protein
MSKLKFGKGNAKLTKEIATFSLPAGHSCPFALECKATADRVTGKITDGKDQVFRCFAVSQEALYTNTRKARWHNYDLLRSLKKQDMINLIQSSLPTKQKIVRVHVSGDFFNQDYFDAWMEVARNNPDKLFYAYTKSVIYWLKRIDDIPSNFELTSSKGGKNDEMIDANYLKNVQVIYSVEEAIDKNLEIDHDDSHAFEGKNNFALLIHGTQAKGTNSAKALSALKLNGVNSGYTKK